MVKSVFRYPGGKSRKAPRLEILARFPNAFSEYREPFVGGGGIYFAIDPQTPRWINDVDEGLIAVYHALRDRPAQFIRACRDIPPLSRFKNSSAEGLARQKDRLSKVFRVLMETPHCDQALRWYFMHRTAYNGNVRGNRTSFSSPERWNIVATDKLAAAAEVLQSTKITCGDFLPLLKASGDDVFIYADPPYVCDTERSKSTRWYARGFEMDDHECFANAVDQCSHKVLISYDDHPWVRERYRDYAITQINWTYSISSSRSKGNELIITNYDPLPKLERRPNSVDAVA